MARDIILNLAVSLDGFICDEDGGFAWIGGQGDSLADTADRFSFDAFLASCDTVVMGRKAYEDCFSSLSEAEDKRFLVASRTPRAPEGPVSFLSGDVVSEVLALKDRPGKHIWLFVGILPVIRGKGRRLFQEGLPPAELHLDRCTVADGIPILEYSRRGR